MIDPIGSFEKIRDFYIAYLDTEFRVIDEGLMEERQNIFRQPGMLATEPYFEPIPRYKSSDRKSTRLNQIGRAHV